MNIHNILVVSPMFEKVQKIVEKENFTQNFRYMPEQEMKNEDLEWADAMVCFNLKGEVDYSKVKWVHSLGAGVDRFLYKKDWNENVLLTRTICSFGQRIAEYSLSYIFKDLQEHDRFAEAKQQQKWEPVTPRILSDQKVMVYGTGEIGQEVAKVFSQLGVEVYGVSLSGRRKEHFHEVMALESHAARVGEMDYIINTLPLTEQTEKLFGQELFGHMSGAGFLNVGRGATVEVDAMIKALDDGSVRFAVLDVFAEEPLQAGHPYWSHPKVFVTPHISAVTTPGEGVACFIETLKNVVEGKPLRNKVDVNKGY